MFRTNELGQRCPHVGDKQTRPSAFQVLDVDVCWLLLTNFPYVFLGVADVDGLHLMVDSNMNGIGPRSSDVSLPPSIADRERMRRPDSLAIRGHEYEELPASRYVKLHFF